MLYASRLGLGSPGSGVHDPQRGCSRGKPGAGDSPDDSTGFSPRDCQHLHSLPCDRVSLGRPIGVGRGGCQTHVWFHESSA